MKLLPQGYQPHDMFTCVSSINKKLLNWMLSYFRKFPTSIIKERYRGSQKHGNDTRDVEKN